MRTVVPLPCTSALTDAARREQVDIPLVDMMLLARVLFRIGQ